MSEKVRESEGKKKQLPFEKKQMQHFQLRKVWIIKNEASLSIIDSKHIHTESIHTLVMNSLFPAIYGGKTCLK